MTAPIGARRLAAAPIPKKREGSPPPPIIARLAAAPIPNKREGSPPPPIGACRSAASSDVFKEEEVAPREGRGAQPSGAIAPYEGASPRSLLEGSREQRVPPPPHCVDAELASSSSSSSSSSSGAAVEGCVVGRGEEWSEVQRSLSSAVERTLAKFCAGIVVACIAAGGDAVEFVDRAAAVCVVCQARTRKTQGWREILIRNNRGEEILFSSGLLY